MAKNNIEKNSNIEEINEDTVSESKVAGNSEKQEKPKTTKTTTHKSGAKKSTTTSKTKKGSKENSSTAKKTSSSRIGKNTKKEIAIEEPVKANTKTKSKTTKKGASKTNTTKKTTTPTEKKTNAKKTTKSGNTNKVEKSKAVKKSKKTDDRIKQIINEQLDNVDKFEEVKEVPAKKKKDKKKIDEKQIEEQIETAKKMPKDEKKKIMSGFQIRKMTVTAILAAVSTVLMFLSFNVPFMPSFIKMDFSELPALIAAFAYGPLSGVIVCLIKNLINLLSTQTGGVGELSNFILGCAFVLPAGLIYKHKKTKKSAVLGALLGAVIMAAFSMVSNYYIVYPIYTKFMPMDVIIAAYSSILPSIKNLWQALFVFNLPFTFAKGLVNVLIATLIYKPLSPILKGKNI